MVARDLLGRRLVRLHRGRRLAGSIVETEAYIGAGDTACHGRSGPTARNQVLFQEPGRAYVYFTYGMHHLVNLVTERVDFPAAVLIRALEPEEGMETMARLRAARVRGGPARRSDRSPAWLTGGPARLCQALAIDLSLNGEDTVKGRRLFVEEGTPARASCIRQAARVGVSYAEDRDRNAPWRFYLRDSAFVSCRPAGA